MILMIISVTILTVSIGMMFIIMKPIRTIAVIVDRGMVEEAEAEVTVHGFGHLLLG